MSLASWDKRMWDDDGSWFKAPSLRTIGTIAGSIAAGVLSGGAGFAGIVLTIAASSASDIVFGSLDAAFGFKTWDEAAFGIGKSILTNTVSSLASGLFNGFSAFDGVLGANKLAGPQLTSTLMNTTNSTFLKAGIQIGMAGVQTLTTGFASSLISGITYDSVNKFGYSTDIFLEGMDNVFRNTLTTVASAVTSTGLKAINSGLDMEKIIGFNQLNKSDLNNLNNLLGSLAGQGVNYALGGDFTLNVFDWNFGNYNSGLLELRFGGDGVSMNFGTGGANVSIGNLSSALRGAAVWNVNNRIFDYGK
ncbi:MAG: hypothetical protein FWC03_13360, partial [Treponema sp.]|nr:hypothetical protein [Treponema sp.]